MKKLIYIAGPYRGANSWEIHENIFRAERLALEVWKLGAACISPHANTAHYQNALPDEVWLDGDLEILGRCDAVLMTDDWTRSRGARAELEFARKKGIQIFYHLGLLANWLYAERIRTGIVVQSATLNVGG